MNEKKQINRRTFMASTSALGASVVATTALGSSNKNQGKSSQCV